MRSPLLRVTLLACSVLSSMPVAAQARLDLGSPLNDPLLGPQQPDLRTGRPRGHSAFTPADAARQVQSMYGGRVLAVQPAADGYRVKVLKDGEVRIYSVSPQE